MRKFMGFIFALTALSCCNLWGQSVFYSDRALGVNPYGAGGVPAPTFLSYGQVRVCTSADIGTAGTPCPDLAAITDINGNSLSVSGGNFGQLTTDVVGRFSFGCSYGNYWIQIAATGSNTPAAAYAVTCPATSSTGIANFKTLNSIRFVDSSNSQGWSGSNAGAWINAAIADLGTAGGTVYLAPGSYTVSTAVALTNGITLEGAGRSATTLTWTGSSSGAMITATGVSGVRVKNCKLSTSAGGTSRAIDVLYSTSVYIIDNFITGSWGGGVHVTGDGVSLYSQQVHLEKNRIDSFLNYAISADHVIELTIENYNSTYGVANNTTARNLILDTGASGVNVSHFEAGYGGANALVVRNTINPGTGAYNHAPHYLFFDQFIADTCTGGDCISFDSTLGTADIYASFSNSWSAAAGLNDSNIVVTAAANGLRISGGSGITWTGGKIRDNAANGILIDNANANRINVLGSLITANNQNNSADAHGIYVSAAATYLTLDDNLIGNVIDSGGNQKYGVKVGAVAADHFRLIGNQLASNITGDFSNANTATYTVLANDTSPSSSTTTNSIWGNNQFNGQINMAGFPIIGVQHFDFNETTAPAAGTATDVCYGDSTAHTLQCSYNNGPFLKIPQFIGASLTTTAATTDNVTVTGMTATGHCALTPTNSGAAGGIASVFVSAKTTNQITVTHTATAGWTFDVMCSPQ